MVETPASPADAQRLRELLDREEIRELAVRYCHYMWQEDMRVVDLYSEDGRYADHVGHAQLLESYAKVFSEMGVEPHPYAGNHVIDFDGPDRATGTCYNDLRMNWEGYRELRIGYWSDVYVRVNGAWKFKSRDFTLVYKNRLAPIDA